MKKHLLFSLSAMLLLVAGTAHAQDAMPVSKAQARSELLSQMQSQAYTRPAGPARASYLLAVPFYFPLETKAEFDMMTLADVDGDGRTWSFVTWGMRSEYSSNKAIDDWAIMPGAVFTDVSQRYELSFNLFSNSYWGHTELEVYIGNQPNVDAMTTLIGKIDNYSCRDFSDSTRQKFTFGVPGDAGTYYIGFRCVTTPDDDAWLCWINHIIVNPAGGTTQAPQSVVNAKVTPAERGALQANVSFTMPTLDMGGRALPADQQLHAIITSPVETLTVDKLPGEQVNTDIRTRQGRNHINLRVDGQAEGDTIGYDVYTGEVLPMRVHNLQGVLSRDNMTYSLTWTAPTAGQDSGYVDYDHLNYDIYRYNSQTGDYDSLTTVGHNFSYTYQAQPSDGLKTVRLGVFARNSAGVSQDRINWVDEDPVTVYDMVGKPYTLPVVETFDNQEAKYGPVAIQYPSDDYNGLWQFSDPGDILADDNHSALIGYSNLRNDATMGRAAIAKFSTEGKTNQTFSVKLLKYVGYSSTMKFYVRKYDDTDPLNLTLIGSVDCNDASAISWADYSFPIPESYMNQPWIQIVVDADYPEVNYMYAIDSYSIGEAANHDLAAVNMTGPATVEMGQTAQYKAEIYNVGATRATARGHFSVVVDGAEAATEPVADKIMERGSSTTYDYVLQPRADWVGHDVAVRFVLTAADDVAYNDTVQARVEVRRGEKPVVYDLQLDANSNLTWTEPALNRTITEGFDGVPAFSHGSDLAGFKNIDRDGKPVMQTNMNMPDEGTAKAFQAFNPSQLNITNFQPHSGSQMLMAICPADGSQANDWLVSPAVVGGSRFSFWLALADPTVETVDVLTSATTDDPSAFTRLATITKYTDSWQQYEYQLHDNARYFAINYRSAGQAGIVLDDVRYVSASQLYTLTGYKVYRDSTLLGTTATAGYVLNDHPAGALYNVTAVTTEGQEGDFSNTVTDLATGITTISTADSSKPAQRYNLAGQRVGQSYRGVVVEKGRKMIVR